VRCSLAELDMCPSIELVCFPRFKVCVDAFDHYLPHLLSLRLRGVDTRVGYPNSVPRALVDESFSSSRIALARRAAGSDEGVVG
jgi:hypothetical protein